MKSSGLFREDMQLWKNWRKKVEGWPTNSQVCWKTDRVCGFCCIKLSVSVDMLGIRWHKSTDKVVSVSWLRPSSSSEREHRKFVVAAVHSANDVDKRAWRRRRQKQPAANESVKICRLRQRTYLLLASVCLDHTLLILPRACPGSCWIAHQGHVWTPGVIEEA